MEEPRTGPSRIIRNCDVLDMPALGESSVLARHDIVITAGRITSITPTSTPSARVADGVEVIDGTGLLAVPGLTNAHTHSPMVMMRGAAEDVSVEDWFNVRIWPMEMNLTPERVRVGARLACAEMLLGGVTAFADHYFHGIEIAQAAAELGIRADIAPCYFSSTGTEGREAAWRDGDAIQALGNLLITASLGPHSSYTVTEDDLRLTAARAVATGMRVHLHAAENMDQTRSSLARLGVTPIEVLRRTGLLEVGTLIAHGCGITDDDIGLLEAFKDRTAVACCPKVYLKHALAPITPVPQLLRAGIEVGAGTDGAAGHNTLDVWESLRLVAMMTKHQSLDAMELTVSDTLRLAMRGGAHVMGLGDSSGALEAGRNADIVLMDLSGPHCRPLHDPRAALVYSVRASDVVTVLVNGEVVVRDRQLVRADLRDIIADADAIASELVDLSKGGAVQHYAP